MGDSPDDNEPAHAGFDTERNLFVRKLLFVHVYYNNGNSLPVFPIPSSRDKCRRGGCILLKMCHFPIFWCDKQG